MLASLVDQGADLLPHACDSQKSAAADLGKIPDRGYRGSEGNIEKLANYGQLAACTRVRKRPQTAM